MFSIVTTWSTVVGSDANVWTVTVPNPHNDVLKSREQLSRFVSAARKWQKEHRLIDLYGRDNLVLDRNLDVVYLDSFGVFFHTDIAHAIDGIDEELEARMQICARRLDYIESLI